MFTRRRWGWSDVAGKDPKWVKLMKIKRPEFMSG